MTHLNRINPYSVLNISPDCSIEECRQAYMKLATKMERKIRQKACLAYDVLCNKEKYIKNISKKVIIAESKVKTAFIILLLET